MLQYINRSYWSYLQVHRLWISVNQLQYAGNNTNLHSEQAHRIKACMSQQSQLLRVLSKGTE